MKDDKISYTEDNTHIIDSYQVKDINLDVGSIIRERHIRHLQVTRTFESYVREWKGHNRLYNLGLFKSHTKDVDLEEPQNWFWKIVWFILGGF